MPTPKASEQDNKPEMKVDAAENTKEREDERLDHGIKESLAGSDPVSVKVSKYAPGDRGEDEAAAGAEEDVIPGVVQQAREAATTLTQKARTAGDDLLAKSGEYVAELESGIQRGKTAAGETVRQHPVSVVVTALLIGCSVGVVAYEFMTARQPRRPRTD